MSALFSRAVFACIAFVLLAAPAFGQMQIARNDAIMQQARMIGQMLVAFANDNSGAYPTGKSSTEIFQKLLDNGYCSDPAVFFVALPGKAAATGGRLKPENVSFDLTVPIDGASADTVPVVFLTGYKISYASGASAVPVSDAAKQAGGIAIFYKGNNATFLRAGADGSVPNVIAKDYQDAGHAYTQLAPDGPLKP